MTLKLLELFSGIGSFSIAMNKYGINHDIVGYSEILETAIKVFNNIHNTDESLNLGDVTKIHSIDFDVDIITFGSPCQSFTRSGKGEGGRKGSGTKSSLMWEGVRIIGLTKPKFVVWENVPDAINKHHIVNFKEYINELSSLGYNTYYDILDASKLGSAQKRKRLFAVSIRKDIDNGKFNFKYQEVKPKKLITYLENNVDSRYDLPQKYYEQLVLGKTEEGYKIRNGTKLGYLIANEGDGIDYGFPSSKSRRGRVQKEKCHTLLRSKSVGTLYEGRFRYFTPLEHWRLMELPDELYIKAFNGLNFSEVELYDVIGGAINQLHLKVIFDNLKKAFDL